MKLLVKLLLLSGVLVCFPAQSNGAMSSFSLEFSIKENLDRLADAHRGNPVCEKRNNALNYVGQSGLDLFLCLLSNPAAQRLYITSTGGEVASSIASAREIQLRGIEVYVLGLCMSSCANYIMPASAKLVLPYPAMFILHGSPLTDEAAIKDMIGTAYKDKDMPEEQKRLKIQEGVNNVTREARLHTAFVNQRDVGDVWYNRVGLGENPEKAIELAVTSTFAEKCLGSSIVITDRPLDKSGAALLSKYVWNPVEVVGLDSPEPESCD